MIVLKSNGMIVLKSNGMIVLKIKWNPGGQCSKNPLYGGNIFLLEKSSTCAAKIHTEFNLLMEKILKITLNKSNAKVFGDEESLSVEWIVWHIVYCPLSYVNWNNCKSLPAN